MTDLLQRLEQLNSIGVALSKERNSQKLMEGILVAAMEITQADAGTFYRMSENRRQLDFQIVLNDSLGLKLGGDTGRPLNFSPVPLFNSKGEDNLANVSAYCVLRKCTVNIADAYRDRDFDFSGVHDFDQRVGYHSQSFLCVPMVDHEEEVIGVLQLINSIDHATHKPRPFPIEAQQLAESLASQAAVVLTNRRLVDQLEELFESFVNLINVAIDEKSPYTGGHCQRVPKLTNMLAEAVHETKTGPLAGFSLTDKDRYELKVAGLLHDCGKVSTPVHVVDKATKLQTIYDRIHLLDTRFEVIIRDAKIAALEKKLSLRQMRDAVGEDSANKTLAEQLSGIESDREILHAANQGSEKMPEEIVQSIMRIAKQYSWAGVGGSGHQSFLTDEEVENLSVRSGTLTKPEREIINNHIVVTIRMLESLPWPKHLRNVPEFAGGHHERMDGRGYPKGLIRDQMSIQARIMGIADIFEALTARDRPYKHAKSVMESLIILGELKENGHIDPDLFDIFIRNKVYKQYALEFLPKEQMDQVDEGKIPGYAP